MQTQLFLGKLAPEQITQTFLVLIGWIVVLMMVFHFIWQKGFKAYGAAGR